MTEKSEHPAFEVLSDFFDGNLSHRDAEVVSEHLSVCASCATTYQSVTGLVSTAKDLPKSVLPADDLWPDLRRSLNARKDAVLPTTGDTQNALSGSTYGYRISGRKAAMLAVAAMILIALSSGITALVLRRNTTDMAVRELQPSAQPTAPAGSTSVLRADFRQTEQEFNRTIDELKQAVDTRRGQLSPETIRTVERSLAVVDSAIAEGRAALMADPNNQMLVDLLSASYQRKLDLLRRTSELGSRT